MAIPDEVYDTIPVTETLGLSDAVLLSIGVIEGD